jgi:2-isopropylmalate synthase
MKNSTICELASSSSNEITMVAEAIEPAKRGRINTYTSVNIKNKSKLLKKQVLETITDSISLARNFRNDVELNAFDTTRSEPVFLCKSIEVAIKSSATTITIPDSLGLALPKNFLQIIEMIFNRVPNIDESIVSVHISCENN